MGSTEKITLAESEERKEWEPIFPESQYCPNRPGTGILCVYRGPRYLPWSHLTGVGLSRCMG